MKVNATLMRGGTSKCWVFRREDVPEDREQLSAFLTAAYGGRDPFEIDGVGGGTSVTSKALVMGPSTHGCDADYLFAQVGIGTETVEYGSNCGNCATAAALWTVEESGRTDDQVPVRLYNLNTESVIEAVIAHRDGAEHLDTRVPGVEGVGVAVELAFVNPEGSNTGKLWPTGHGVDTLAADGREWTASMTDAGAPIALVPAEQLGVSPAATIADFDARVPTLRQLRRAAALAMGISKPEDPILDSVPKIGVVGAPQDYTTPAGHAIKAADYDVSVRFLSMLATHPAIGLTSAVAVTLMAQDPDSVVARACARDPRGGLVIGTPGGLVKTRLEQGDGVTKVFLQRAARRMADATLHLPDSEGALPR